MLTSELGPLSSKYVCDRSLCTGTGVGSDMHPRTRNFPRSQISVMRSCLATLVHIVVPAADAHARDDFFYPVSLCCRLLDEGCNPYSTGVRCSSVPVILRVLKPSRSRRCFRSIPASPSCCSNVSEVYTRKVRSTGLCRKRSLRLTLP